MVRVAQVQVEQRQNDLPPTATIATHAKAPEGLSGSVWKPTDISPEHLGPLNRKLRRQKYAVWALIFIAKYVNLLPFTMPLYQPDVEHVLTSPLALYSSQHALSGQPHTSRSSSSM